MLRPSRFDHKYGAFFDAAPQELPKALIDYCQDTCRAIELLEGQEIVFDPVKAKRAESPDIHYFYFVRSRLANEFIHLNAEFANRFDKARCILLATKIIDYLVLLDNYIITVPIFLAEKIRECLEAQDIVMEWDGMEDALMWVLWVAACVPQIDMKLKKDFMFLANQAEINYEGTPLSTGWNKEGVQYHRARRFVWAGVLDDKLGKVCDEEERFLREKGTSVEEAIVGTGRTWWRAHNTWLANTRRNRYF